MLVVIAIITVLAGILFPTFARARGTALAVSCASNLRQCGIAMQMYRDDWDGKYPAQDLAALSGYDEAESPRMITGPEKAIWFGQLYPYLKTRDVMMCKCVDDMAVDVFNGIPIGFGLNISITSYSEPGGDDVEWHGPHAKADSSPTTTMVLADCSALVFEQTASDIMAVAYANAPMGTYDPGDQGTDSHQRHVTGSNVVFADGHVQCFTALRLLADVPMLD